MISQPQMDTGTRPGGTSPMAPGQQNLDNA